MFVMNDPLANKFLEDIEYYIDYTFPYSYPLNLSRDCEKLREIFNKYVFANNQEGFNQSIKFLCETWNENSEYHFKPTINGFKKVDCFSDGTLKDYLKDKRPNTRVVVEMAKKFNSQNSEEAIIEAVIEISKYYFNQKRK